jgi:hypothetical protein
MARYKEYSYDQGKLIALNLREQLVPGTFEFALNCMVDEKLELSVFERRYRNDETFCSRSSCMRIRGASRAAGRSRAVVRRT